MSAEDKKGQKPTEDASSTGSRGGSAAETGSSGRLSHDAEMTEEPQQVQRGSAPYETDSEGDEEDGGHGIMDFLAQKKDMVPWLVRADVRDATINFKSGTQLTFRGSRAYSSQRGSRSGTGSRRSTGNESVSTAGTSVWSVAGGGGGNGPQEEQSVPRGNERDEERGREGGSHQADKEADR